MAGILKPVPGIGKIVKEIKAEWDEFVSERAFRDEDGFIVYGHRLLAELGETGLATLRYLARRGDRESARILVERLMGLPEQPYTVQIAAKSADETAELIRGEII